MLLLLYSAFTVSSSICYCLLSVDFSRVSWTLGLIYCRHPFALGALPFACSQTVSPRNTQTLNAAVFHFPLQPLYSESEPKATHLLLCTE